MIWIDSLYDLDRLAHMIWIDVGQSPGFEDDLKIVLKGQGQPGHVFGNKITFILSN
jgi:hypothetical protein